MIGGLEEAARFDAVVLRGDSSGKIVAILIAFAVAEFLCAGIMGVAQVGWNLDDFALLYRFGPNLSDREMRWTTPGSVIAVVLWLCASGLFRGYIA